MRAGVSALSMLALTACATTGANNLSNNMADAFSADRIKADVTFLADDTLKGRDTGSEGYRIAANYVAAEFARLGLKPMGNEGTYFQEVPFKTAELDQENSSMSVTVGDTVKELTLGDDYFMGGYVRNPNGDVSGDVVFVGYGVHAPELGHDDLEGLDLEGKVALAISGAPTSFQTEIRAHHGSTTTKKDELAKRGVVGTLFVSSLSTEKRRPFSRYKGYLGMKSFDWFREDGAEDAGIAASAAISHEVAETLFEGAERSFVDVMTEAEEGAPKGFALKTSTSMKKVSKLSDPFYSPNVLGVLEGSDPALKDEYVVMTAHLDHVGVSDHAKGEDKINNGALDNASGVSVMMEVARAYVRAGIKPRRSILFAAVAAEEKGLLGAEYFAKFPTVEKSKMVANVNVDMPVLLYDFSDIVAFGADRSTLGPVTSEAVAKIGVTLSPDPMPEEGIFTRSDHYRFVQQGIPSVFLVTGWGPTADGEDGGAIFREFLGKTYHRPHDDLSQDIDYAAGAKFAYVNWLILNEVANATRRPSWNDGDFFGDTFGGK
ncbi:MAG: M20/M25/M40 family metallo-hydrolase [Alphaproteobacteria bacterium]|nr:M20/M25/M40 family metallo-hydrolase [Alphaproteobacteria bacterium]